MYVMAPDDSDQAERDHDDQQQGLTVGSEGERDHHIDQYQDSQANLVCRIHGFGSFAVLPFKAWLYTWVLSQDVGQDFGSDLGHDVSGALLWGRHVSCNLDLSSSVEVVDGHIPTGNFIGCNLR